MDRINQQFCFTHTSGEDIYLFTLTNAKGTIIGITNYGAIISSYKVRQADGSMNDIVLGFDDISDYVSPAYLSAYPYFGAVIGRYGNRIKNGRFILDGKEYQLATNNASDHLHGGITGFDKKVWQVESFSSEPVASLTLRYVSPDGEEGYPGTLDTRIKFELNDDDEFSYDFTASTDQPTILNLTHHSYFNLNNGEGRIDEHTVSIAASAILEQDDNFVTTGQLIPVDNSIYDFTTPRAINKNWNAETGYDQSFVLNNASVNSPAAVVWSDQSGLQLEVFTTEPVVHLYTGKWIGAIRGRKQYGPYSALCLETQKHPNAINIPGFPSTVLRAGDTYHTRTVYKAGLR